MKDQYINILLAIIFLAAMYLTGCSVAEIETMGTVETEDSELTVSSTVEPIMDTKDLEERLLHQYSQHLLKKTQNDECFHAIGANTLNDTGLASIIAFCDIDFDNIPELFAGYHNMRGYCYYSIYGNNGVIADEICCGMCSDLLHIGDNSYSVTHNISNQSHSWLQISDKILEITVQDCDDNTTFNVTVISSNQEKNYNDVVYDDVDSIFKQEFGVSYTELQNSTDCNVGCVIGHLIVPDPENYTEEDIYNCLLALLQEYEDKVEE